MGAGALMQSVAILSSEDPTVQNMWWMGVVAMLSGLFILLGTLALRYHLIALGASLGSVWYLVLTFHQAVEANAGRAEWVAFTGSLTLFMLYLILAVMNLPPFVTKRTDIWSPDRAVPDGQ